MRVTCEAWTFSAAASPAKLCFPLFDSPSSSHCSRAGELPADSPRFFLGIPDPHAGFGGSYTQTVRAYNAALGRTQFRVPDRGSGNPTPFRRHGSAACPVYTGSWRATNAAAIRSGTASTTLYGLRNIGSPFSAATWGSGAAS